MSFIVTFILILLFNIPFGYWRGNVRKFSFGWFLSVHLPVPFVIFIRYYGEFGWQWYTFPIFVSAFFLGQYLGSSIYKFRGSNELNPLSSCLFMDIIRQKGRA